MKKGLLILLFLFISCVSIVFSQGVQIPNQWYVERGGSFSRYIVLHETDNQEYYQYINGRYAFSALIPRAFTLAYFPGNGDGCRFYSPDKSASLRVSGGHNTSNWTLNDYSAMDIKRIGISNTALIDHGTDWFVISWTSDDKIHYQKTFVSNEYANTLEIIYPIDQKENFDEIVSTVEESFVPGWKTGYKLWG